ncbi:transmembrane protein 163 isoform X2 [Puntigrus tetrazona]|uniref:transmembrane protein 163 isoform X2 n=1 Tax=Puntigrus tetrazona TaxID=1606681 RepID=UPI001C8919B1|nr:transmembrane protein 163 isoform X2 [Puntigrus tetrazona]
MTEPSSAADPTAGPADPGPDPGPASVPDPAVLGSASTPANGHHPSQADTFNMEQQMKMGETDDNAVSIMRHSASAFGFAFDATLDVLSSIIVLWRYSNAAAVHSAHREYIACVILGVVFILSAITILVKAIHDLATKLQPEVDDFLYSVSVISGIVCAILSVFKFMLGKVLTSRALITDGFNSLVGAVMGFSILVSAEVFKHEPKVWYLDGTVGVLIGLIILAYGVKLLKDMVPRVRQTRHYERFE